jgi:hypothetical protein
MTNGALAYFMLISQGFSIIFIVIFILMLIRNEFLIKMLYVVMCLFMFCDAYMTQCYTVFDLGLITVFLLIGFYKIYESKVQKPMISDKK